LVSIELIQVQMSSRRTSRVLGKQTQSGFQETPLAYGSLSKVTLIVIDAMKRS
jgi:hypothetical protein